jgi:hypothetical protein
LWYERFSDAIASAFGGALGGREAAELARLNPDKIYVENVRSLLRVSHKTALSVCETAVRQGFFARSVEVLCPDNAVAASAPTEAELPETVRCWSEHDGDMVETEHATRDLAKVRFYRLNDESAAVLFRPTA